METGRLSFGMNPESPLLQQPGIVLKVLKQEFSVSKKEPIRIHGCCRIVKKDLKVDKKNLPAGIFVTAVEMFGQQPVSSNLLGEHIVLEDDIVDQGSDYIVYFHFNLVETVKIPIAPFSFIIHASFYHYISNFICIELVY
jgi:hypothetical protein